MILVLGLFFTNLVAPTFQANAAVATSGLVARFNADDGSASGTSPSWVDLSGNSRNATFSTTPGFNTDQGDFYDFNGGGRTGEFATLPSMTVDYSAGFSASFYADFADANSWERIIDFGNGQANGNIVVARDGASNDLHIGILNGNSSLGYCNGTGIIINGAFAHYAVTLDGNNCYFYRNGRPYTSVARFNASGTSVAALTTIPTSVTRTSNYIAKSNWASDANFSGRIGELSIYNRGLSSNEIYENYKSEAVICIPTVTNSGSTYYLKFTLTYGCSWQVPAGVTSMDYLIVGAGGGGGGAAGLSTLGGGGGGAGGAVLAYTGVSVDSMSVINMLIGGGGSGGAGGSGTGAGTTGTRGRESAIKLNTNSWQVAWGGRGGQGGGGGASERDLAGDGASSGSNSEGGFTYAGGENIWDGGGGGGGAGTAGSNGSDIGGQGGSGGAGGAGVQSSIADGNPFFAAGGGGGGTAPNNSAASAQTNGFGAAGGSSIGGTGGMINATDGPATAGAANTGSGGGGGGWISGWDATQRAGASGANGIIWIKFTKSVASISSISVTSSSGADSTYRTSETIEVTVTFTQDIIVTGSPRIPIQGLTSKFLTYSSGTNTPNLKFTYSPVSGDVDADGFSISSNSLALNGGSLVDLISVTATITHSAITANIFNAIDTRVTAALNSLTFSGQALFRKAVNITASITQSGKITFRSNGKKIANCINLRTSGSGTTHSATCAWKPATRGYSTIVLTFTPTNANDIGISSSQNVFVSQRTGTR
jgi:hypothetical protein